MNSETDTGNNISGTLTRESHINMYQHSAERWNDCPALVFRASEMKRLSYENFMKRLYAFIRFSTVVSHKTPLCTLSSNTYLAMKLWLTKENCVFFIGVREEDGVCWLEAGKDSDRTFGYNREIPDTFDLIVTGQLVQKSDDNEDSPKVKMEMNVPYIDIPMNK